MTDHRGEDVPLPSRGPSSATRWVELNTGRTLDDGQARCVEALDGAIVRGLYNLDLIGTGWRGAVGPEHQQAEFDDEPAPRLPSVEFWPDGLALHLRGSLGTYDGSEMTRLVLAAHRHAVRIEVTPKLYLHQDGDWEDEACAAACLRISLTARVRDGGWWDRHPSLGEVLADPAKAAMA